MPVVLVTFNTGDKLKADGTVSNSGLFNPVGQVFTPLPTDAAAARALILGNLSSRLAFTLTGVSGGKAYSGKTIVTKVVTTETLGSLFVAGCTGSGVKGFHSDPVYSTLKIN